MRAVMVKSFVNPPNNPISDYATLHSLVDNIAINCGASGKSIAVDGGEWIGDIGFSNLAPFKSTSSKSNHRASDTVSPVPYMTARISSSQFSYTLQLSPGQKFIRLHFYPTSYSGFGRSKAFFTVKAGPYTLLSNFSASLAADALGLKSFAREFCVNVEENRALTITFSPSPASYAFINGIEIVSMPAGLYYTDSGVYVVGQKYKTYIKNNTALETSHRLNIGGGLILSVEDSGMFRQWFDDTNYLLESSGLLPVTGTVAVKFMNAAPPKLYQTAWSMDPNMQTNQLYSFTWKLPVDLGFRYLVRLHFCDLEYRAKESHYREFSVFINNQMAEAYTDLLRWNGGNGVAMHRDYMVTMEGERVEESIEEVEVEVEVEADYEEDKDFINLGRAEFEEIIGITTLGLGGAVVAQRTQGPMFGQDEGEFQAKRKTNSTFSKLVRGITRRAKGMDMPKEKTENGRSVKRKPLPVIPEEPFRHLSVAQIELATNNFDSASIIDCDAPEYINGLLTDKSNVYSFGVVLLEVVSAREEALYLPPLENRPQLQQSQLEKGGYIDPFLIRTKKMGTASLRIFVEIMESCLQFNWRERPSMGDVVEKLEYALQLQEEFTESAK
ncbi:Receptor-like protein kinase FERONIA [Camellia lanceoleosa]|uniref:Receptor-like protein kinase FERONIA n=1 Tax=Camellia lanceoleosa TaxID=1840588 RepID=A0ACC0I1Q0_9ERIC|nr:Receptor-like protein kinase FERONIA [Camellia lanceoleosa]